MYEYDKQGRGNSNGRHMQGKGCGLGFGSLFDNVFDELFNIDMTAIDSYKKNFPPLDIYTSGEDADLLHFDFALAGYDEERLHVKIKEDKLNIYTNSPSEPAEYNYIKRGIKNSDFNVTYSLMKAGYDLSKSKASFKNGILSITIPKDEDETKKEINLLN